MNIKPVEFSVVGAGRFGLFWGEQLSKHFKVVFYDREDSRRTLTEPGVRWESLEYCLANDFVFLTIPIRQIAVFLQEHREKFTPGTVIIDCASVKMAVAKWFREMLPAGVYYMNTHPLFGPDSARDGLADHAIAVMPGRIPYRQFALLINLFSRKMKLRILNLSAKEHDRLMAYNLSLIHHLGRTFHEMRIRQLPLMMTAIEEMDHISRVVMNDTEELFQDFYRFNPYSETVEREFMESFQKIRESILGGTELS